MKKFVLFIVNTFLFLLLLSLACVPLLLIISYIDIVFGTAIEASYFTLFVVIGAWLAGVVLLYFVAPKKLYGSLPGSALVGLVTRSGASTKPLIVYCVSAGVFLASGYISIYVNSYIFGRMVAKEEKTLESLGMSFDWKSYFPQMDYKDPDNAAPHIEKAGELLTQKHKDEAERLWKLIAGETEYDFPKTMAEVKALTVAAAEPVAAFEKALKRKKFLIEDLREKKDYDVPSVKIPSYAPIRAFVRIKTLEAVNKASNGDWNGARKSMSSAATLNNILEQEPFLIGYLIRLSNVITVRSGLLVIVKEARDKDKALELVKTTLSEMSVDGSGYLKSMRIEFASSLAFQKTIGGKTVAGIFAGNGPGEGLLSFIAQAPYYAAFGKWDRYVYLKAAGMTLKGAEERDIAKRRATKDEIEKFMAGHTHLPALLAAIAMPSYDVYLKRKLSAEAGTDVTLLFASVLHYKSKYGRYPDTLDKLVPVYMKELPVNPINGKPYIYKTSGGYMEVIAEDEDGSKAFSASMGKRPQ